MSLTTNTTSLQSILDAVNELPNAGGGGAVSIPTCTVAITSTTGSLVMETTYTQVFDGMLSVDYRTEPFSDPMQTVSIYAVACGTLFGIGITGMGTTATLVNALCVGCNVEMFSEDYVYIALDDVGDGDTAEIMLVYE